MDTNKIWLILSGSVEQSNNKDYKDKVGVVSVVYASADETKVRQHLETLHKEKPDVFYMQYEVPMDVKLTELSHYPSIEITKEDLEG